MRKLARHAYLPYMERPRTYAPRPPAVVSRHLRTPHPRTPHAVRCRFELVYDVALGIGELAQDELHLERERNSSR